MYVRPQIDLLFKGTVIPIDRRLRGQSYLGPRLKGTSTAVLYRQTKLPRDNHPIGKDYRCYPKGNKTTGTLVPGIWQEKNARHAFCCPITVN